MLVARNHQPHLFRASMGLTRSADIRGAVFIPCLPQPSVQLTRYPNGYTALIFPSFFFLLKQQTVSDVFIFFNFFRYLLNGNHEFITH